MFFQKHSAINHGMLRICITFDLGGKTRRYCYKDNEWVSKAEATASDDVISVREQTTSPSIKKSYE